MENKNESITNYDSYTCPSFSSYSQTAVRVATEINKSNDDEFEFSILRDENEHVYPIFNQDLTFSDEQESVVVSLETLFLQDQLNDGDQIQSCSSSEVDELDDIPPESYCVWKPKATETPEPSCKKSKSTGSASKRWKIRDFMRRSNSDGKDSFVFLTPPKDSSKKSFKDKDNFDILAQPKQKHSIKKSEKAETKRSPSPSAHETLYVQNRAVKEENRRKSYLPYRRDLVGFFANVNVLGKNVTHF